MYYRGVQTTGMGKSKLSKLTTFRVPNELWRALEEETARTGLPRNVVAMQWLVAGLRLERYENAVHITESRVTGEGCDVGIRAEDYWRAEGTVPAKASLADFTETYGTVAAQIVNGPVLHSRGDGEQRETSAPGAAAALVSTGVKEEEQA